MNVVFEFRPAQGHKRRPVDDHKSESDSAFYVISSLVGVLVLGVVALIAAPHIYWPFGSPHAKSFARVRAAARELDSTCLSEHASIKYCTVKTRACESALQTAVTEVALDPERDPVRRRSDEELIDLYRQFLSYSIASVNYRVENPLEPDPFPAVASLALQNTEAGFFDHWKSVTPLPPVAAIVASR